MGKSSRFKYEYRANASKLHRAIGEVLRNDKNFKHLASFQEYPVNKVNPRYPHGSHKFDWVIPSLKVVIEGHGIQHYRCQTFGAKVEDAIVAFHDMQRRDKSKKEAALKAGWIYIVVAYNEPVTARLLFDKIRAAEDELDIQDTELEGIPPKGLKEKRERERRLRQEYLQSDKHKERLERARKYRKQQYKKMKELKDGRSS